MVTGKGEQERVGRDLKAEQTNDLLLLVIITLVLGFVSWFFTDTLEVLRRTIENASASSSRPSAGRVEFMREISVLVLYGSAVKTSAAFLVGSLVALIGCLIIVRGTRVDFTGSFSSGDAKSSLKTNSAGIVVTVVGATLVGFSIHGSQSQLDLALPSREKVAGEVPKQDLEEFAQDYERFRKRFSTESAQESGTISGSPANSEIEEFVEEYEKADKP